MRLANKSKVIIDYFDEILPDAKCELNYTKDYELLIAVMLSAQTTDKAVNAVTSVLFDRYKTLDELNLASIEDIETCIHRLGLYKNKAKNIKLIVYDLINRFGGKVPSSMEELTSMSGIGRKTANVVRCELFSLEEFPVDTHIERIAKRLGYADESDNVLQVEMKLRKAFPKDKYIKLHHQFIHFGRYYCSSRNPCCANCPLKSYCKHL